MVKELSKVLRGNIIKLKVTKEGLLIIKKKKNEYTVATAAQGATHFQTKDKEDKERRKDLSDDGESTTVTQRTISSQLHSSYLCSCAPCKTAQLNKYEHRDAYLKFAHDDAEQYSLSDGREKTEKYLAN